MIIVLDTNIWLKELALNSNAGSALKFFLKYKSARLAVPKVIRLEVQANLRLEIKKLIEDINKNSRQLLALFGSMKEIILPSEEEIEDLISNLFINLQIHILDIDLSLESAESAFLKIIQKVPPCDKTQEFKDAILWADCIKMLEQDDVLLATQDKAFFLERDYNKGLAENLKKEASLKQKNLIISHSIDDVLKLVGGKVDFDESRAIDYIKNHSKESINDLLYRSKAEISGPPTIIYKLFSTENPNHLYMKYQLNIPCFDASKEGRSNMQIILQGNGIFNPSTQELFSINSEEDILEFKDLGGNQTQHRNSYLSANIDLGHRTINHSIRNLLNELE